jgi:hypothetical protein
LQGLGSTFVRLAVWEIFRKFGHKE